MAVLNPIKVLLSDAPKEGRVLQVPDFPFDPSRGSHTVEFDDELFIDSSDFRLEDSSDYFGLAPGKSVGLKYSHNIRCDKVERGDDGELVSPTRHAFKVFNSFL